MVQETEGSCLCVKVIVQLIIPPFFQYTAHTLVYKTHTVSCVTTWPGTKEVNTAVLLFPV